MRAGSGGIRSAHDYLVLSIWGTIQPETEANEMEACDSYQTSYWTIRRIQTYPAPLNSASNLLSKYHDGYTFLCLLEKE